MCRLSRFLAQTLALAIVAGCGDNAAPSNNNNNVPGPYCGDGIVNGAEMCDDGNHTAGDGCSGDCRSDETCGNGVVDAVTGEECDIGQYNSDEPNATCRTNCRLAGCGDGVQDLGEECDDGAANSDLDPDSCRTDCTLPTCGDGTVDSDEVCDDGNQLSGDGCRYDCSSDEICGNGIIDPAAGEMCDNGSGNSDEPNAFCRTNCHFPICGDGILDDLSGEECDDATANSNLPDSSCRPNCTLPSCGDGVVDPLLGETCDNGSANSNLVPNACRLTCQPHRCGDHVRDTGEACDDGNNDDGDSCRGDCLSDYSCGNGISDPNEECDDGNSSSGDGCNSACEIEFCGDGVTQSQLGEDCDDGNYISHDGCSSGCTQESLLWRNLSPETAPSPRAWPRLAYDIGRDRVVLFGGYYWDGAVSHVYADTWEYDGTTWTEIATPNAPAARACSDIAYDSSRGVVVLFGGSLINGTRLNDTWEYDGTDWVQVVTPNAPSPRYGHRISFDSLRSKMVLFGGQESGVSASDYPRDTWEYDGADWAEIPTSTDPVGRRFHGMAYNSSIGATVLFGGNFLGLRQGETWTYDGTDWSRVSPTASPLEREDLAMTHDLNRGKTVVFSGWNFALSDTWEFDGTNWALVGTGGPADRMSHDMTYAGPRRYSLMFGGTGTGGSVYLNDTWKFQYWSSWPDEDCRNGVDDDSDGLVDCSDPDCEGRSCSTGICSTGACL